MIDPSVKKFRDPNRTCVERGGTSLYDTGLSGIWTTWGDRMVAGPSPSATEWGTVESLPEQVRAMAKRLYVGNLAYSATSEELQELFAQYGQVRSAQVLSDRETGRSRGFGFIEMDDDADAEAAIEALDGNDHQGRRLTVNEAKPRTPGGGGGGGDRGGYGGGGDRGGYGGGRGYGY